MSNEWNESLFGCFDDCSICMYGWCCSPCLFGQNAEKIDGSSCCGCCCAYWLLGSCFLCWVPHMKKRETLRQKFNLREDPSCGDCLTTAFCGACALCQEARFLQNHAEIPRPAVPNQTTTRPDGQVVGVVITTQQYGYVTTDGSQMTSSRK